MDRGLYKVEITVATVEEVAAWLSSVENRPVSINEIRKIEAQALRKLRSVLVRRGLRFADLITET